MKKVLLYLLIIVFSASFIGIVFQLSRDDETISATTESGYLNVGEKTEIDYTIDNKKKSTKVSFKSSNEDVIAIEEESIKAVGKGNAVLTITIQNARKKTQMIQRKISVGDGSSEVYPLYIRNENDLLNLANIETYEKFFEQVNDIVITKEFETISKFEGNYNGKGHKIINYQSTGAKTTSAMFDVIYDEAKFAFVIFENVQIYGAFENASVVANTNYGLIDYVEVTGSITTTFDDSNVSAIATNNIGDNACIQRCVNKAKLTTAGYAIGGIATYNSGVITCCQNGDDNLASTLDYNFYFTNANLDNAVSGGIVAFNKGYDDLDVIVANNYSINEVIIAETVSESANNIFGGIIGIDQGATFSVADVENKNAEHIFGNYYLINDNSVITRGIGNVTSSTPDNEKNLYIANGLTFDKFQDEESIFVSYAIKFESGSTAKESWPTDVWVLNETVFPHLIEMSKVGYKSSWLKIKFPVLSVAASQEINSVDQFLNAANDGTFTNTNNTGKTYYITSDIDFSGKVFKMVGTTESPVVVNIEGKKEDGSDPILSNIVISSQSANSSQSIGGLFGVVKNASVSNIILKNCKINEDGSLDQANFIGGLVGTLENSQIINCEYIGDGSTIAAKGNKIEGVGGIAGVAKKSKIINCDVKTRIDTTTVTSETYYVGGVVGILGRDESLGANNIINNANSQHTTIASSYVQSVSFNGKINATMQGSVVGGAAGYVDGGAVVETFKSNGAEISAANAGGVAGLIKGIVELGATNVTLKAVNGGGFAYKLEGENSRIYNSYCETKFTNKSAVNNSGIACEISEASYVAQCVHVNDFCNNASASKNFARTKENVKFEFSCEGTNIQDLNFYSNKNVNKKTILMNCFYVNKVDGKDSKDRDKTRFYSQTGNETYIVEIDYVDTKAIANMKYNGTLRNGRLKREGGLAAGPKDLTANWQNFFFTNSAWINSNKELDTSNILYIKCY